jgi:sarcosine oxidase, subunit beta
VQTTAEVLIVGAGINGVATAFSLAERGMEDILIVDRSHPAAGASGRGMGLLRTYHANEAEAKLAIASLEVFRNWRQLIGGSCGFIDAGFLWLDSAANVEQVKVNAMMLARLGASTTLLTPNDLQRLQPMMRVDDVAIAAFEPAAGAALPQFATESLLAAAQRSGVRLLTHTPALGLLESGGRVYGIQTREGPITAGHILVAAGAWTAPLLATVGVALPIESRRLTVGRIHAPGDTGSLCAFLDGVIDTSFRPDGPGAAIVSMRDDRYGAPIEPEMLIDDVDPEARPRGMAKVAHRLPGLGPLSVGRTWTGVDGFTPDFKGIYGAVDDLSGLYICAGASEKGFKVAPAVGRAMAEVIATGVCTQFDLRPFAPARFIDNDAGTYRQTVSALL